MFSVIVSCVQTDQIPLGHPCDSVATDVLELERLAVDALERRLSPSKQNTSNCCTICASRTSASTFTASATSATAKRLSVLERPPLEKHVKKSIDVLLALIYSEC